MREQGSALILLIAGIFMLVILVALTSLYLSRISLVLNPSKSENGESATVTSTIDQASSVAIKTDLKSIQTSLEIYLSEHGSYPNSLEELNSGGYINQGVDINSFSYQICNSNKNSVLVYKDSSPYPGFILSSGASRDLQEGSQPVCP